MALLYPAGYQFVYANGTLANGELSVFDNGTSTYADIYSDPSLTVPLANPVQLDGDGRCVNIYVTNSTRYTVQLNSAGFTDIWGDDVAGGVIFSRDNVWGVSE